MQGTCLCGAVVFEIMAGYHPPARSRSHLAVNGFVSSLAHRPTPQPDWFRVVKGAASLKTGSTATGRSQLRCEQCETILL